MLPVEILILIAQVCLSPTKLDIDVKNSIKCNQYMIECINTDMRTSRLPLTGVSFSKCMVQQELEK